MPEQGLEPMPANINLGLLLLFTPHAILDMLLFFTPMVFLGQNPNPIERLSLCQVYTPMVAMSHSPSRALRQVSLETVPLLQLEEHVLPKRTARGVPAEGCQAEGCHTKQCAGK